MKELLLIIGSYIGILLLSFGVLNWLMGGKLMPFIKVKASRGKLILVNIRTLTHDYYKPGTIDENFLIFKDRKKEVRRISIEDNKCLFRASGVNNIVVDDEKNAIFSRNLSGVSGFDAIKYQLLYLRALYKPQLNNKQEKIMLFVLLGIGLAVIVVGFLVFKNGEAIKLLQSGTNGIAQVIS